MRQTNRRALPVRTLLAATPLLLLPHYASLGQVGQLDVGFANNGVQTVGFSDTDWLYDISVLTDGTILAVGTSEGANPNSRSAEYVRMNQSGAIESTFSFNVHGCLGAETPTAYYDSAPTPDGGFVAAGYGQYGCNGPERDFWILNSHPPNPFTFAKPSFYGGIDYARQILRQPDGKLLLAGYSTTPGNISSYDVAFSRHNSDGSLDTTFSSNGETTLDLGSDDDFIVGAALMGDGRIVTSGYTRNASGNLDLVIIRLLPSGDLDTSFDGDGIVTLDFNANDDWGTRLAIQPDDHIVVAGTRTTADSTTTDWIVLRFSVDGSLDNSFGVGGVAQIPNSGASTFSQGVRILENGKIVVGGTMSSGQGGAETYDFGVARLTPNGALDPSFGTGGLTRVDYSGDYDFLSDLEIQSDGAVVIGGVSNVEQSGKNDASQLARKNMFTIVRLVGDGVPLAVDPEAAGTNNLTVSPVYPNPVTGGARLAVTSGKRQQLEARVYDLLGRQVALLADRAVGANQSLDLVIDGKRLAPGTYFVHVSGRHISKTQAFVKR